MVLFKVDKVDIIYGTFNLSQWRCYTCKIESHMVVVLLVLEQGSGWVDNGGAGGGLAGIFSSSTINQSNARQLLWSQVDHHQLVEVLRSCKFGGGPSGSGGTQFWLSQINSHGGGGAHKVLVEVEVVQW